MFIRYAHFHAGATVTDATGTVRTVKGRLVATVATTEIDDLVAVGVSRVNPGDSPVKFVGRAKARARMERAIKGRQNTLVPRQTTLLHEERDAMMSFFMTRDDFLRIIIKGQAIQRLATATTERERERIRIEIGAAAV